MTITSFTGLFDFGFNLSFTRNITYIFSGVHSLKTKGHESVSNESQSIDYGLLKGVISAMRWFYLRMATILFILLTTLGTYYIYRLLRNYNGNHLEVYIAWMLLCLINTYNLFTLYYDSLLQGKGLVKRSKQIVIVGQIVYLLIASLMIIYRLGLIAIVSAQVSSVIIVRFLSYHTFFTTRIKQSLNSVITRSKKEVIKAIYPNAIKIGLTSLGGFLALKSAIIIGSFYLSLDEIASYGITIQLITIISGLAGIYTVTYQPKIMQLRVENNCATIKKLYLKGQVLILLTFISGGMSLLLLGDWGLRVIGSQTNLMPKLLILVSVVVSFLECNHSIAHIIILSKNEVPFFRAALFAGCATVTLLFLFFRFTNMGMWAMIAAPGIAQGVYQNWKWPSVVFKELKVTKGDIYKTFCNFFDKIV